MTCSRTTCFGLAAVLLLCCVAVTAQAQAKLAVDLKFASTLQNREPADPGSSFAAGKVYCWTRITGGQGEFKVFHVWYREGKKVTRRAVRVKGKRWTTWSYHKVTRGAWRVEVQDAAGKILASGEFVAK